MYVHTYVRTYVRTYIRTYVCTYIHTYIHIYIHTNLYALDYGHIQQPFSQMTNILQCDLFPLPQRAPVVRLCLTAISCLMMNLKGRRQRVCLLVKDTYSVVAYQLFGVESSKHCVRKGFYRNIMLRSIIGRERIFFVQ